MTNFQPDDKFLDFVLELLSNGNPDEPLIRMTDGHHSLRTVVDQMRKGQERWKPTYDAWYDDFKTEFEKYQKH